MGMVKKVPFYLLSVIWNAISKNISKKKHSSLRIVLLFITAVLGRILYIEFHFHYPVENQFLTFPSIPVAFTEYVESKW